MMVRIGVSICCLIIVAACGPDAEVVVPFPTLDQSADLRVHAIENSNAGSKVRAHVVFENSASKYKTIDLTCLELSVDSATSDEIYVDRIAHILPENYTLNSGLVSIDVYWFFNPPANDITKQDSFAVSIKEECEPLK